MLTKLSLLARSIAIPDGQIQFPNILHFPQFFVVLKRCSVDQIQELSGTLKFYNKNYAVKRDAFRERKTQIEVLSPVTVSGLKRVVLVAQTYLANITV